MAKIKHSIIAAIILVVFITVILMLLLMPANTGKAVYKPPIEDKFSMYFLTSAVINNQANHAIYNAEQDRIKHGRLPKNAREYFGCDALLENINTAKEIRETVMQEFSRLAEMNCFFAVSDADLKKFRLLEEQCRNQEFNTELPSELQEIYDYQKKALNKGCMKHSGLRKLLSSTKISIIEKNSKTQINIQK